MVDFVIWLRAWDAPPPPQTGLMAGGSHRGVGAGENPLRALPCWMTRSSTARQSRVRENGSFATLARGSSALAVGVAAVGVGVGMFRRFIF